MSLFKQRRQLFEVQDFSWCPPIIRQGVTSSLKFFIDLLNIYGQSLPLIEKLIQKSGSATLVDLCSGAGGPLINLSKELKKNHPSLNIILSDLYPPASVLETETQKNYLIKFQSQSDIYYYQQSVDATNVPSQLKGTRLMFTSFHHMPDVTALQILENAAANREPIGIFEFTERNLRTLLLVIPSAFNIFIFAPFIFKTKFWCYIFTYVFPLIPLISLIDIVMSIFRTRDLKELEKMTTQVKKKYPNYHFELGKKRGPLFLPLVYLIGYPHEFSSRP